MLFSMFKTIFNTPNLDKPRTIMRFSNVSLSYPGYGDFPAQDVLKKVNFELAPGSFHFLTGPSGAGKTSLIKLMYLGLQPTSGDITLFDHHIYDINHYQRPFFRRKIGVVFQEYRLIDHLTVLQNVAMPLLVAGMRVQDIQEHVVELLEWVGLGDCLDAKPQALSGGQQQRVAIARSVIAKPALLLADEPTGNVDDRMAHRIMHLFEELNRMGTTIVIASHNENLVRAMGHPIMHLSDGRVEFETGNK